MSLSGDIRDGHLRIGEWSAERQPGTGGVHPYRWWVKLSSGPLARGVVVHDREDGTLGLVIKVLTAAVQQFGDRDHPDALAADVAARGYRERAERAEAARDQLREEARRFAEALGFGDGRTDPDHIRSYLAQAWEAGHRTPWRRGPDECSCSAWSRAECACGKYGTGELLSLTDSPYAEGDPR